MPPKLQRMLPALYLFGVLTLLLCPSVLCRDCENFPRIAHGSHQDVSSFLSFTTVVRYECDEGYVLVGKPEMTCKNSQWSWPAPQCKALCMKPEVENGNLSVDKDQYVEPEKVTIQCDSGYGIVGPEIITCSEDGTWHPKVPKCEWEIHNGCEQVLAGRKLMQCLSSPEEVKTALEIHKLFLEIKRLKQE